MGDGVDPGCGLVPAQPNTPAACGNCYANADRYASGHGHCYADAGARAHEHGDCRADGNARARGYGDPNQGTYGDAGPGPHRHANGCSRAGGRRPRTGLCHL